MSTGKNFASPKVGAEYRRHEFFRHSENTFKKISASQNKVLMVKFVINCMLNIQTQHRFFFNVKLIYSMCRS